MNLREAAELAIEALQSARSVFNGEGDTIGGCGWCHAPSYGPCEPHCEKDRAVKALRAALAEDAMQRLTDEQQMIESHIGDDNKMVATINETETVEPVAYVTGYSKGRCIIEAVDPDWLLPVGMALYRSPPTINEMETVEPVAYSYPDARGRTVLVSTNTAPYEDAKPLYTAPPKREPLTEEEIEFRFGKKPTRYMLFLIRSTERAHGIGSDK